MNFLYVIITTVFTVLLNSNYVTPQSQDERQLSQVMIGRFTREKDDFNSGISETLVKYKKFPNANFGNNTTFTFQERNGTVVARESVLKLEYNKGKFTLEQFKFLNGFSIDSPADKINSKNLVSEGPECIKTLTLEGSTYKGNYAACSFPRLPNGSLVMFQVSLNCTRYVLQLNGKVLSYVPTRGGIGYEIPASIAPTKRLCQP